MQFNQITYFLRACDTLNFTRAAQICHVSQPSLSAAIHRLEEELGNTLFDRDGRAVKLTPFGESMRVHLSRIEQAKNAANLAASHFVHDQTSVIDLGFMCTLSPRRLLTAIASFGKESSNNELLIHDVWESKALELLVAGALDCVIMAHTSDLPAQFEVHHLANEPMLLAVHETHPLADRDTVNYTDLQDQYYVDRLRCEFREKFFEELGMRNLQVQVVLRSEREDIVSDSISEAIGITIMPKSAAENAGLKTCSLGDSPIVRRISVVTLIDREIRPSVKAFIQHVCQAYRANELVS